MFVSLEFSIKVYLQYYYVEYLFHILLKDEGLLFYFIQIFKEIMITQYLT